MLEVRTVLDFACCFCQQSVSVTVKCEGKGLAQGPGAVATCKVPCPTCGSVNQLYFEPSGVVRCVSPCPAHRSVPEPSVN
jgi:hypothetical protein